MYSKRQKVSCLHGLAGALLPTKQRKENDSNQTKLSCEQSKRQVRTVKNLLTKYSNTDKHIIKHQK